MSEFGKSKPTKAPMYLDDRSRGGHIIVCAGDGSEHSFFRPHLGLSVECPVCGQIALSVDLITEFYGRPLRLPPRTSAMPGSDEAISP